jgi:arylsulfatase A-like enzyme
LPFILQGLGYETAIVWSNGWELPWHINLQGFKHIRPSQARYLFAGVLRKLFFNTGLGSYAWLSTFIKSQPLIITIKMATETSYFGNFAGTTTDGPKNRPSTRGLEPYMEPTYSLAQAEKILGRAQHPFFLWVHLFPPHAPFLPPKDFLYAFLPERTLDTMDRLKERDLLRLEKCPSKLSSADIDKLSLRYDENILYADHELGNFLRWLKQKGLFDQSLLIVSSDHGEMFEKKFLSHGGPYLNQSLIQVPLLIHLPGQSQGERIGANVSQVDLAPTILDFLGIKAPAWMDGKSFKKALYDSSFDTGTKFSMNLTFQNAPLDFQSFSIAALQGDYKLIKYLQFNKFELYNLKRDPGERNDLLNLEPERLHSLNQAIAEVLIPRTSK